MPKLMSDDEVLAPKDAAPKPKLLSDDDVMRPAKVTAGQEGERSTAASVLRALEFGSRGVLDRGAEIIGAPADLFWQGVGAIGLPTPGVSAADTLKGGIRKVGEVMNAPIQSLLPADMGPNQPETTGEKFAYGAGRGVADAGSIMVPGAALSKLAPVGSLTRAVGQTAAAQPVTQAASGAIGGGVTEATDNPLLGAAASLAAPLAVAGATRVISPVRSRLTPEEQRLADVAKAEGIQLTAGQETGSPGLQLMESVFGTLPSTAGAQRAIQQTQRGQFNRAALGHIGEGGNTLTPEILNAAKTRIGGDLNRLAAQTKVDLDQPFVAEVAKVVNQFANRLEVQRRPIFERFVKDILGTGGMPAPMQGALYQTVRSDLSRMAKNYGGTDPTLAEALRGLRDALDDAADRSMPASLKGEWADARREYGNLRTLERAMSNTTTGAAIGNLQPTQLAQAVKQQHPRAYAFGAGPMNDLSLVGRTFMRDQIPNSGTAQRTLMANLLTGFSGTGGAALLTEPTTAAAIGAGTVVLPRLAQMAYNSPAGQAYFRNRLAANAGPNIDAGLLGSILAGTAGRGLLGQ